MMSAPDSATDVDEWHFNVSAFQWAKAQLEEVTRSERRKSETPRSDLTLNDTSTWYDYSRSVDRPPKSGSTVGATVSRVNK